jgi:hypothetical protein
MGEDLVSKLVENSVVAGAFIYLLTFQTKTIAKGLEKITENMTLFASSLTKVSEALLLLDARVAALEKKVDEVGREVKHDE